MPNRQEPGKRYVSVIVVLLFLMIFTGLGFVSSPRSLLVIPVTEELGIDRSPYAFVDSIRFVSSAVCNLFFGALVTRFGSRRLIAVGFALLTSAMLLYTFSHCLVLFYLAGALLGVGFTFTTTTMVGYVINCWCPEKKGTIMGAVLAANGLGGAVATQIVSPMINGPAGWRASCFTVAAVLFTVGLVTTILFRDKTATPAEKKTAPTAPSSAAFSRTRFLTLAIVIFMTGFVLQGLTGVAAAHLRDTGVPASWVATALSVHMLCLTGSKFLTGFLYDKLGLRWVTAINMTGGVAVAVVLAIPASGTLGIVLALAYGVLAAFALPLETVMLPIYTREFFDKEHFARTLGFLVSINTAGYALGSPCLNFVYDRTGSYFYAFLACAVIMAVVLVLIQTLAARCPAREDA